MMDSAERSAADGEAAVLPVLTSKEFDSSREGPGPRGSFFRRASRLSLLLAVLVISGVAIRTAFFWNSASHIPPSADESMMMLLAKGLTENSDSPTFEAKQYPRFALGRFPILFVSVPYCLPVEAYLMAPFDKILPRNAFGARVLLFTLGLLMVFLSLLVLRKSGGLKNLWPAAILILFPSAYLMSYQAGYALPFYYSVLFFASVVALLVALHAGGAKRPGLLAGIAGLVSGIACCDTLIALPVLVASGIVLATNRKWKEAVVSVLSFAAGALVGLGPYFAAKYLYPGAYEVVSARLPLDAALDKLWFPSVSYTIPSILGIRCPIFPDASEVISRVPWLVKTSGVLWATLLLAATLLCVVRFVRGLVVERALRLGPLDLFMGMSWMSLALFVLNQRSGLNDYRYMLLVGWCFPFLVGYLYLSAGRWLRVITGTLAVFLVIVNTGTTWSVASRWASEGFASDKLYLHDVNPLIEHLEKRGIKRCYATNWNSYRINFASDERIVSSAPFNELFPGWPMPYMDMVDASTNVAVVLSSGFRFLPAEFDRDLKAMNISCRRETCGKFTVYSDFKYDAAAGEKQVEPSLFEVTVSHCPEEAGALKDGNYLSRWRAREVQAAWMWFEVEFKEPRPLSRLSFYYDGYPYDMARSLNILARDTGGKWKPLAMKVPDTLDPFDFRNGHPVFSRLVQTIRLETTTTDALRIEICQPNEGRDWTVGELEVYEKASE